MRAETAATILEYFGGSSWARPDSKRHAEAEGGTPDEHAQEQGWDCFKENA